MNQLPIDKQAQIFQCIAEGNSLRSTARLVDVSFNAVLRTFVKLGRACQAYQSETFHNFKPRRLQLDEVHSFVGARQKNTTEATRSEKNWGDIWIWLAIDAESKLVPCWHVGARDLASAETFLADLAGRLSCRVQISTDGLQAYVKAIQSAFGEAVDFGQIMKIYNAAPAIPRYAPPVCVGAIKSRVIGTPSREHISTSYAERLNLTLRMKNRRFTRLTNAFSKKVENHYLSLSIHFMHYNFCRIHQTLRVTPAMEAGYANHVWEPAEVVALLGRKRQEVAA